MTVSWRALSAGAASALLLLAVWLRPDPPTPAWAQGVGIFSRASCTELNSPVMGQTFCFEGNTNTLKFWNGASWTQSNATQSGINNVRDFGAVGDGSTDDTAAIQAAVNAATISGANVYIPAASYNITNTITIPHAVWIQCESLPGNQFNKNVTTLKHNFSGTFLSWVGSPLNSARNGGGGMTGCLLLQVSGTGTGAAGTATLVNVTDHTQSPQRLRFLNNQIETDNSVDSWTVGFELNGLADAGNGVHDVWIENSRIVGDTNSTAAIRIWNGRNIHLHGLQLTGTNAHTIVTGLSSAGASSAVYLSNVSGAQLQLDVAENVNVVGGAFTAVTMTATTTKVNVQPGALDATPTMAGSKNIVGARMNEERSWTVMTDATITLDPSGGLLVGRSARGGAQGAGTYNASSATFVNGLPAVRASATSNNVMSVRSISATQSQGNNLRGTCTFSSSNTCSVTFSSNEPDANFFVVTSGLVNVGSKTVNGFTLTATTAISNAIDWILFR